MDDLINAYLDLCLDVIVFTAGTAIMIAWVLVFIELYDRVMESRHKKEED